MISEVPGFAALCRNTMGNPGWFQLFPLPMGKVRYQEEIGRWSHQDSHVWESLLSSLRESLAGALLLLVLSGDQRRTPVKKHEVVPSEDTRTWLSWEWLKTEILLSQGGVSRPGSHFTSTIPGILSSHSCTTSAPRQHCALASAQDFQK